MSFYALVGDIGGTNARFALIKKDSVQLHHVKVFDCLQYTNFDQAVQAYYQQVDINPLDTACISFASPVGDYIDMTNNHWAFDVKSMQKKLALKQFRLLNDFTAMAYGTLYVNQSDKILVQAGADSYAHAPRLVIGPGTGLGVASLIPLPESNGDVNWHAIDSEGGHISFAAQDDLQLKILKALKEKYQRVSVERLLSGDGIVAIYQALSSLPDLTNDVCITTKNKLSLNSAAQVTDAALSGADSIAVLSLQTFCEILGAVTGDMVLAQGARGGVYLCGGILPRIVPFFINSRFCECFRQKGRFESYLSQVPIWLCDAQYPGLLGAAAALKIKKK